MLPGGARARRRFVGHFRAGRRRAGRRRLRRLGGAGRSADRRQSDAQPLRRRQRLWHCARPRRRRAGQAQGRNRRAGRGPLPLSGRRHAGFHARGRPSRAPVRAASGARREKRPEPGLAAESAEKHRPAPDQCLGGHHQFHDVRSRPPAPCVRRQKGLRTSRGPSRRKRREPAGARWPDLCAGRQRGGHRRRQRRRIACGRDGRRILRLRREHHRRADRIRFVGPEQYRPHRPQARHRLRCALSVRARRRSRFRAAGTGTRDGTGAAPVRRRAVGNCRRRPRSRACGGHRFPAERGRAPDRRPSRPRRNGRNA